MKKKKIIVNKTKDKNHNYFWPLNGFLFYEFNFSFCRIRLLIANSEPLIFISSMAIDKLLAIKLIAMSNVSNSM